VPLVKVPPAEIGTWYCVPLISGSNCVIGEPSWNWRRRLFRSDGPSTAVSPSESA